MNYTSDLKIIKKELKLISYHSYISTFFTNYKYREKILLIIFINIELLKIIRSNLDKSIIIAKLNWWKITCSEAIDGKNFGVPSLRLLSKYFKKNNYIKEELSKLINCLVLYSHEKSFNKKIKFYSKYLLIKNNIVFHIIQSKTNDHKIKKSLNLLVISKSLSEHNSIKLSNRFYNKAKITCKRPKKFLLILFLLNTNKYFTKVNLYKKLFIFFTRDW